MMRTPRLVFAEQCAWRAAYLYAPSGIQLAHIGFDPNTQGQPRLFGAIGRRSVSISLPAIRWRHPMPPALLRLYQLQQKILHRLDGRFRIYREGR